MRRPTQHHTIPAIESAWAHPYAGVTGLGAVSYTHLTLPTKA